MYQPELATKEDMSTFHTSDYVTFLASLGSSNKNDRTVQKQLAKFAVGEDCPVFEGLWDFCQIYTSGSLGGAAELIGGGAEVAVNWSGGLHHAKKAEASGFCYINDCVLAILELLKAHQRVLYIDIDIHHGDGVEEAFYSTNRVMTLSFHKFGDYFPGTGAVDDTGCAVVSFFCLRACLRPSVALRAARDVFQRVGALDPRSAALTASAAGCRTHSRVLSLVLLCLTSVFVFFFFFCTRPTFAFSSCPPFAPLTPPDTAKAKATPSTCR